MVATRRRKDTESSAQTVAETGKNSKVSSLVPCLVRLNKYRTKLISALRKKWCKSVCFYFIAYFVTVFWQVSKPTKNTKPIKDTNPTKTDSKQPTKNTETEDIIQAESEAEKGEKRTASDESNEAIVPKKKVEYQKNGWIHDDTIDVREFLLI